MKVIGTRKDGKSYIRIKGQYEGRTVDRMARCYYDDTVIRSLQSIVEKIKGYSEAGMKWQKSLEENVKELEGGQYELLVKTGLIEEEKAEVYYLGSCLQSCVDSDIRAVKGNTLTEDTVRKRFNTSKLLIQFIDRKYKRKSHSQNKKYCLPESNFDIRKLTAKDGREFCKYMQLDEGYAYDTLLGKVKQVRSYFKQILNDGLIGKNIFDSVKPEVPLNHKARIADRRVVIGYNVLSILEDLFYGFWDDGEMSDGWMMYYILLRWTGARKNEPLHLRWTDIDWERERINMPQPKVRRYKEPTRSMPMFIDSPLKKYLGIIHENQGSPVDGYVVRGILNLDDYDRTKVNWKSVNGGTTLIKKIKKYGGTAPWPKLFQNLRVTRENELMVSGKYRVAAVLAFLGHAAGTFSRSYFTLTEEDFNPIDIEARETTIFTKCGLQYSPSYSPTQCRCMSGFCGRANHFTSPVERKKGG